MPFARRRVRHMDSTSIALLQMLPCGSDQDANLAKGEAFCRRASRMGADIALFPEMWNVGYALPDPRKPSEREAWEGRAIGRDGPFVARFRELAVELDMAIALTYLEHWDGRPRNSMSLIDRHGEIGMTYAKVHTCEFDRETALTPGDGFYVHALDTRSGLVNVGAMICYGREFPESARILMLQDAELILTPNACTLDDGRIGQFKARAFENMVGVAMANYAAPKCNGRSVAFDAVSFGEIDGDPKDTLVVQAGEDEDICLAQFDMDEIRAYRERGTWGNAYRRPRLYGLLTSPDVREPFIRHVATR